jgi:hypothetical protein
VSSIPSAPAFCNYLNLIFSAEIYAFVIGMGHVNMQQHYLEIANFCFSCMYVIVIMKLIGSILHCRQKCYSPIKTFAGQPFPIYLL